MANTVSNQPGTERITPVEEVNPLENIQARYEGNKKRINTIVTVVLVAIVGFFAWKKFSVEPKETKAATQLSFAQTAFSRDSMNLALNGDGQHPGLLNIIKRYGSTKAGNLAHYYAGVAYLQTKDFKNAIKYLKEFDAHGSNVQYAAYGALGDAYMESGDTKNGIEYYMKAAGNKDDAALTPLYLYRAAIAYQMNNQADKAKENFKRIKEEFPMTQQGRDVDRELARLGVID